MKRKGRKGFRNVNEMSNKRRLAFIVAVPRGKKPVNVINGKNTTLTKKHKQHNENTPNNYNTNAKKRRKMSECLMMNEVHV